MPFVLSSCPVLNTATTLVQTVEGCWLSYCPVLNTAASVVQTAGGVGVYVSPCIEAHLEAKPLFSPIRSNEAHQRILSLVSLALQCCIGKEYKGPKRLDRVVGQQQFLVPLKLFLNNRLLALLIFSFSHGCSMAIIFVP